MAKQHEEKPLPQLNVTIKELLEAAAHFGHRTDRWNPKMKRFIFEERNGLYIIDLAKTMQQLRIAVQVVRDMVSKRRSILFVGTKKQAKDVIKKHAEACAEPHVNHRWLGGCLTNLPTISQSIKKLEKIEKQIGTMAEGFTKKELSQLTKSQEKLERNLSGIRTMRKLPGLLVVVDTHREHVAVAEARKLGIPVMGLIDTNCDPDLVDYIIPCNDDALKSIQLIIEELSNAIIDQKSKLNLNLIRNQEEAKASADMAAAIAEKEEAE